MDDEKLRDDQLGWQWSQIRLFLILGLASWAIVGLAAFVVWGALR